MSGTPGCNPMQLAVAGALADLRCRRAQVEALCEMEEKREGPGRFLARAVLRALDAEPLSETLNRGEVPQPAAQVELRSPRRPRNQEGELTESQIMILRALADTNFNYKAAAGLVELPERVIRRRLDGVAVALRLHHDTQPQRLLTAAVAQGLL